MEWLKKHSSSIKYFRPKTCTVVNISLVAFADSSHIKEANQLCELVGIMMDTVLKGNPFHLPPRALHRSRFAAEYTPTNHILTENDAVDEIVLLTRFFS